MRESLGFRTFSKFLFLGGDVIKRSEALYQKKLIDKIKIIFPDCFIIKNDPVLTQGIPDLLILFDPGWAMLEVKADPRSQLQPNQEYYVEFFNNMSFCAFVNPAIEEQVLNDLQQTFGVRG
jgi:hypothetical protein